MTKYKVSDLGPIDRMPPGTIITDQYTDEVRERLIEEGYIVAVESKPQKSAKKRKIEKEVSDGS